MADMASGFLEGLSGSLGTSAPASLISLFTGGLKGRPQWKDLEFMNDATNRLFPDEIKRQGQFLEGLAPSQGKAMQTMAPYQAGAYNTYQDATYGQDTARQTGRIQEMSKGLGMSPWEMMGTGSQTPMPAPMQSGPQQGQGQNPMGGFLQGLVPLQIAKMQNKTQLATAKMQTDASKEIAGVNIKPGSTQDIQSQATKASQELTEAMRQKTTIEAGSVSLQQVISLADLLLRASPTDSFEFGGQRTTGPAAGRMIMKLLEEISPGLSSSGAGKAASTLSKKIPQNDIRRLKSVVDEVAKTAGQIGGDIISQGSHFLQSLGKKH